MFHRSARLLLEFLIFFASGYHRRCRRHARSLSPVVLALTIVLPAQAQTLKTGVAVPRPIVFVPNHGQAPADVLWQAQGQGFEASFRRDGFALRITGAKGEPNLSLVGIDKKSVLAPLDPQPGKINFFLGKDQSHWVRGLPTFARLRYQNVYPGIDLLFYGNQGKLEYDFVVAPGANPDLIRLRLDGSPSRITDRGELQVGEGPSAVLHRPVLYQNIENGKRLIEGKFVRDAQNTVAFRFSDYDTSRTLIIDPALSLLYSTYLGGYHDDEATGIALDSQNDAYIVGYSQSPNYPVTSNAYQQQRANPTQFIYNVVLTKIDSSGFLLFSTFLGGSTGDTSGGIVLDSQGNAYITGFTLSSDFPVTANAYQTTFPSGATSSAFLSELSPDGSTLVYSSFFGGAGGAGPSSAAPAFAIARNPQGNVVISGNAGPGLPTTSNAYLKQISTGTAAFVAVFNLAVSGAAQLVASTYYGASTPALNYTGTGNVSLAMALDSSGNPWIAGQSYTNNLPTTGNAYQGSIPALDSSCGGETLNSAGFFAKLSANLTTLDYASYLSGVTGDGDDCSEYAHAIVLDGSGNVYVAGTTSSSAFPTTSGVFQQTNPSGSYSEFVTKVSPDGTHLLWSTYLGGSGFSFQDALAIDSQNHVWVSGTTQGGANFPLQNAYQATEGGGYDGHITQIKSDGTAVLYSTYLGGSGDDVAAAIALDQQGNVYVAGYTASTNFPLTSNAFQSVKGGGQEDYSGNDIFFSILGPGSIGLIGPTTGGNTGDTTITIGGDGFQPGDGCALVQGNTTIQATALTVSAGGTSMSCTFALNGAATGSYSVVVTNAGGTSLVQSGAFTVENGGSAQVWADVIGRTVIRNGVPATFVATFGNSGASDAYFAVLWVGLSSAVTFSISGGILDLNNPSSPDYTQGNTIVGSNGRTYIPFLIPFLPAGANRSIPIQITATSNQADLGIQAYIKPPWSESRSYMQSELSTAEQNPSALSSTCLPPSANGSTQDCLGYWVNAVAQAVATSSVTQTQPVLGGSPPALTSTQLNQIAMTVVSSFQEGLATAIQSTASSGSSVPNVAFSTGINIAPAPLALAAALGVLRATVYPADQGCVVGGMNVSVTTRTICSANVQQAGLLMPWTNPQTNQACQPVYLAQLSSCILQAPTPLCPDSADSDDDDDGGDDDSSSLHFSPRRRPRASFRHLHFSPKTLVDTGDGSGDDTGCDDSSSGGSEDPNDKGGPSGDLSASRYVRPSVPLSYVVSFENQASATLPVSQAIVTDQLDPTKVNLSSLTLGSLSFGTTVLTPPSGVNSYATTYSINSSLSVRIQGSLNLDTGLLKWTFTTIDPSTGLPPSDPTVGFLPPDANGVEGQAAVVFTVMPIAPLTTGTPIANRATVVFDANAPINTPTWLNTIDANPPVSSVTALPSTESSTSFTVSWSGTDVGSGIATYTIFVSDNGGAYTPWQAAVTTTSAAYSGQPGHTYAFYSIATDGAGNVQAPKSSPDTTTMVSVQAVNPCDVGSYGSVTVGDVQQLINEALGLAAGVNDLNGDKVVNVVDVQIVTNAALKLGCYTQ